MRDGAPRPAIDIWRKPAIADAGTCQRSAGTTLCRFEHGDMPKKAPCMPQPTPPRPRAGRRHVATAHAKQSRKREPIFLISIKVVAASRRHKAYHRPSPRRVRADFSVYREEIRTLRHGYSHGHAERGRRVFRRYTYHTDCMLVAAAANTKRTSPRCSADGSPPAHSHAQGARQNAARARHYRHTRDSPAPHGGTIPSTQPRASDARGRREPSEFSYQCLSAHFEPVAHRMHNLFHCELFPTPYRQYHSTTTLSPSALMLHLASIARMRDRPQDYSTRM